MSGSYEITVAARTQKKIVKACEEAGLHCHTIRRYPNNHAEPHPGWAVYASKSVDGVAQVVNFKAFTLRDLLSKIA